MTTVIRELKASMDRPNPDQTWDDLEREVGNDRHTYPFSFLWRAAGGVHRLPPQQMSTHAPNKQYPIGYWCLHDANGEPEVVLDPRDVIVV